MADILATFGFPDGGDNVRRTPANIYDTVTVATGTLTYRLFSSDTINGTDRNIKLPLSSTEVLFLNRIEAAVYSTSVDTLSTTSFQEVFGRSYLKVVVNGAEKMKIPMLEILNYMNTTKFGNNPTYYYQSFNSAKRAKKLSKWLIVGDSQAVEIYLVMSTNSASALNGQTIRFNFTGVKQNKLYAFTQNFIDSISDNSYTIYDTQTGVTTANQYNLFASQRADTDYSITLDRYDAGFVIQALEVYYTLGNVRKEAAIQALRNSTVKLLVNGTEMLNTDLQKCLSLNGYYTSTFVDAGAVSTGATEYYDEKNILVLSEPIVVAPNSPVSCVLTQPAYAGVGGYVTACLYGELNRRSS